MIRETIQNVVANITETCMNEDVYVTDEESIHCLLYTSFKNAIAAGRAAYLSGLGRVLHRGASASRCV